MEELYMDFTIQSPEERTALVQKIIDNTPEEKLTSRYLEKLSDYIIFAIDKQERKAHNINTPNRMVTINKRETSFEGLVTKFENGEDGIYNLITNDKNILLTPKISITPEDIEEIPGMKELREAISTVEDQLKSARGSKAYNLKKQIIEMRQQQYILKNFYKPPTQSHNLIKSASQLDLAEKIYITPKGEVRSNCIINLYDPASISLLLCNYSKLKEDSWDRLNADIRYVIMDLENLIDKTLKADNPLLFDLLVYKIDGKQNAEIQSLLLQKYGITHSIEYISALWRKKIPKLLAKQAENDWLEWHYTIEEKGQWKRCSRCGRIKLAHNNFFSKNKTSKDGFYSICKKCRNGGKKD